MSGKYDVVAVPGPGDDSATQIEHALLSLLHEIGAGLVRAGAATTIEHHILVFGQFVHAQGYQVHGQFHTAWDDTLSHFGGGANVYKQQVLTRGKSLLQGLRIDLVDHVLNLS